MPAPLLAAAVIPAVTGLVKSGIGLFQSAKAKRDQKKLEANRPKLERTAASREREQMARQMAGTSRLPGQAAIEGKLGAQTAQTASRIKDVGGSTSDIIGGLTKASAGERESLRTLGVQGAQMQRQSQLGLQNVLGDVSQEQYDIQEYNKLAPWREKMIEAKERKAEGRKSLGAGISDIGKTASMYAGMKYGQGNNVAEDPAFAGGGAFGSQAGITQ